MSTVLKRTRGYLYSIWTGRIIVAEGYAEMILMNRNDVQGRFIVEDIASNKKKRYQCAAAPRLMFNKVIWLEERDDDLAKSLFIKYEEQCIKELEEKIKNHEQNIKTLKGS